MNKRERRNKIWKRHLGRLKLVIQTSGHRHLSLEEQTHLMHTLSKREYMYQELSVGRRYYARYQKYKKLAFKRFLRRCKPGVLFGTPVIIPPDSVTIDCQALVEKAVAEGRGHEIQNVLVDAITKSIEGNRDEPRGAQET